MFHLHCPKCGAWAVVPDLRDPDAALQCGCCPLDHHHGHAANACACNGDPGLDPGHEDCTVCRPITITPLPGTINVGAA